MRTQRFAGVDLMARDPDVHSGCSFHLTGAAPSDASGSAAFRSGSDETLPQGIGDLCDKRAVARPVPPAHAACGARRATTVRDSARCRRRPTSLLAPVGDQAKADLPAAGQLDIDLREQLRVEQRAMLDALASDRLRSACTSASRLCLAPGWRVRASTSVSTIRLMQTEARPQRSSSWLRKPKSKLALCATSGESPMNSSSSSALSAKRGLSDRKIVAEPVDRFGLARHRPLGIEISNGSGGRSRPGRSFRCSRFRPCGRRPPEMRPVVSVSKMISRMASLYTRREAETSEDMHRPGRGFRRGCPRCR